MENLGLNSEVLAGGKRFHVQTNYSEPTERIISNIFDNGRLIIKKELDVKGQVSVENIQEKVNTLHKDMVSEMELLFYISDKVKTIKHPVSNNKLGLVFLKKNLVEEAIREFKTAIEHDPDYAEAYNNLGRAYLREERYVEAIEAFQAGIERSPDYADIRNNLGYVYFQQERYPESIKEIQEALRLNSHYSEAHFNLGIVYLKSLIQGVNNHQLLPPTVRQRKALEHLRLATENSSRYDKQHVERAFELVNNNELEKALEELFAAREEGVGELEDVDFENEFYLKFMFGGKGKDDKFIQQYTEKLKAAIERFPEYADLRNNLGIVYLIQCRNLFLNALEEFRQALKINPSFKKAEKNLKLAENDGKGFLILLRAILK